MDIDRPCVFVLLFSDLLAHFFLSFFSADLLYLSLLFLPCLLFLSGRVVSFSVIHGEFKNRRGMS